MENKDGELVFHKITVLEGYKYSRQKVSKFLLRKYDLIAIVFTFHWKQRPQLFKSCFMLNNISH